MSDDADSFSGRCPTCGQQYLAEQIERLTKERDDWAAKWHRVRAELAELKYPGMKWEIKTQGKL